MPRSRVVLPPEVRPPFTVYRNGVPQREGAHFTVQDGALVFDGELKQDRVGLWRWALGAIGVGTYRQDDQVDVRYELAGRPRVAQGLPIVPDR